jgi:PKD repeat protein
MRRYLVLLVALLIYVIPSACTEIAYSSGLNGEKPVGQDNITEYKGTDFISFTTSVSPRGPTSNYNRTKERTVDDIRDEINKKINRGNEDVRSKGLILAAGRSGAQRIDQICAIYDYMASNWSFASDWRGMDEFQYSNYTLDLGKESGYSGIGDCDDFSILLSALIESIGGTPRIILAYSPSGGHAYTEVYMGNSNNNTDIDKMKKWIRRQYKVNEVYIHSDPEKGDIWLNMDWWTEDGEEGAILHPGGPFFQATSQVPIYIQEEIAKSPLTPIENQPPKPLFNYSPPHPYVDDVVCFNASGSFDPDPDGKIVDYEWDFGDGDTSHKLISRHVYSNEGNFSATLTVKDDEGGENTKTYNICVKVPLPEAIGTYTPINPKVGEDIAFDATQSADKSGQIIRYEWDFDDGISGNKAKMKHQYTDSGTYNVRLTVYGENELKSSTTIKVNVSQEAEPVPSKPADEKYKASLPQAIGIYTPINPKVHEDITFDATQSTDNSGQIIRYEWDFDDGYLGKRASIKHSYTDSGIYKVNLTVFNDKGLCSSTFIEVNVSKEVELTPSIPADEEYKASLPQAIGTYTPINPKAHEDITFDATQSTDKNGQIIRYEWDFDDGYSGKRASIKHSYTDNGTYNVNLTVFNDKGLCSSTLIEVNVRQEVEPTPSKTTNDLQEESLPNAAFSYSPSEPKADQVIIFNASRSVHNDGKIFNYEWDFGDGYSGKGISISHTYYDSGTYEVKLTVTDDKVRSNTSTKNLLICEAASGVLKMDADGTTPSSPSPYSLLIEPKEPEGNYATITIRSAQYKGFDVKVDDVLIGSDGKGSDALDGIYTFRVIGNQQHTIRAEHPYNWKWWQYPYDAGESYSYDF